MGFWIGYAETPEEREWAERRDYEDYQAQRDAEDVAQKDRRIAELEAALGSLWDAAVTVQHDGKRGCFVAEPEWRKAMSAHPEMRK